MSAEADEEFKVRSSHGDVLFRIKPGDNLPGFFLNTFTYHDPGRVAESMGFYFSPSDMRKMALWVLKNLTENPRDAEGNLSLSSEA